MWGEGNDEEEEEGGDPGASSKTASGISMGMKGGENGGTIALVSLEEDKVDGMTLLRAAVLLRSEYGEGAGFFIGGKDVLGPSLTSGDLVKATVEDGARMGSATASVVLVVVMFESCVEKRYGRTPKYKAPKASKSK